MTGLWVLRLIELVRPQKTRRTRFSAKIARFGFLWKKPADFCAVCFLKVPKSAFLLKYKTQRYSLFLGTLPSLRKAENAL